MPPYRQELAEKLRDLFEDSQAVTLDDVRLLTIGRHYRMDSGIKIVLGRDNKENTMLLSMAPNGYRLFVPHGFPGPVALLTRIPHASHQADHRAPHYNLQ